MRHFFIAVALGVPFSAGAVGSDDFDPPKPTETTIQCEEGQIWDGEAKACVDSRESHLTDDGRYRAVRELAYAGQYPRALAVLDAMAPTDDRVLTYRGFVSRQQGHHAAAARY